MSKAVDDEADQARHHLRLHAVVQHLQPDRRRWRGSPRPAPGSMSSISSASSFAEEADRGERERQEAGERAEAEHRDEENRDDHLLKACATTAMMPRHRR